MRNRAICRDIREMKLAMGAGQKAKHSACLAKGGFSKNSPDGFSICKFIRVQKVSHIEHPHMRDFSGC